MNIKELAIQCGMFNEASILNAALFDKSLNDFAQAVIAQFISEQKPVAYMYVNTDGECEEIYHVSNGYDDDDVNDEITPLYTLGGQP